MKVAYPILAIDKRLTVKAKGYEIIQSKAIPFTS